MTDADALATFEALVQSQQPATEAWTPVTDYSIAGRRPIEEPHSRLIKDTFEPTFVIDAGCGPDGILVRLLLEDGVQALGFDRQIPAKSINPNLMQGDLCESRFGNDDDEAMADLVICREVLEHLTIAQIRIALRALCRMTTKFVYVTTRFHPDPQHLLDVATSDDLDQTHITLLNQDFLRTLFVLEGFRRRPDLETAMDWKQLGRVLVYER